MKGFAKLQYPCFIGEQLSTFPQKEQSIENNACWQLCTVAVIQNGGGKEHNKTVEPDGFPLPATSNPPLTLLSISFQ